MPLYEHVFIARQDVSAQQVESLTEQFSNVITENGGKIAKGEYWGLKNLAYKVKKNRKGHYQLLNIDAPHAAVAEMERQMSLNEDVLRHMTLRVDAHEEGPSAMMQSRGDRRGGRSDRGERGDRGPREGGFRDRGPREDRNRDENKAESAE
ncbi:MAG: 30S ribosomal protein S6 [Alphaproteobacteria bacterium]|jgi:small subunit ribosomal protein S6|nr:30S ribosomal protein S6 [Rhodobiaceae bacterium]MBO6541878.1 30S ribosomal protein S6 [Alphaproteobacteria bacterium]MBO6628049.1 30S ribosomal protein S6 [Alphaproteobacteria bacterium]MDF1625266.1 30S ribosomal protein S6 [Parvibaculaceae bacterium]|tara:strand:+ start:367 stop:819 length:453 start_codon:yes stop_codon:yes gene_type:complete